MNGCLIEVLFAATVLCGGKRTSGTSNFLLSKRARNTDASVPLNCSTDTGEDIERCEAKSSPDVTVR